MKVTKVKSYVKHHIAYCKKTVSGFITEYMTMSKYPHTFETRKISKEQYVNTATGEVHDYMQSSTRADNRDSLRKTFKKIRDVINANCTEPDKLHWVTLTYKDNMTDAKQLYTDFKKFMMRFYYFCDKNSFKRPEYISVAEPQARGAWHMHLLLIWDFKRPFLDNNTVFAPIWGHGFTKIKSVKKCDNFGSYLSAYLADVSLDELSSTELKNVDKSKIVVKGSKKIIKGGRLSMYPVGMNIFRSSKGIKRPVTTVETESKSCDEIRTDMLHSGTQTYRQTYSISDDNDVISLYITKIFYNLKRKLKPVELLLQKALLLGLSVSCS